MNRLHATLSALALFCLSASANAATTQNYQVLGPTAATYAPLVGGTPVTMTGGGIFDPSDEGIASVALPASLGFRFYGQSVSTAYVAANGFITFNAAVYTHCQSSSCYYSTSGLPTGSPDQAIYALWHDYDVSGAQVTAGPETVNGTQVFTIDYHNVHPLSGSTQFSFKVRLYPSGSKIEVIYGAIPSSGTAGVENLGGTMFAKPAGSVSTLANKTITYLWADKPDLRWTDGQIASVTAGPAEGDPVALTIDGVVKNDGTQDAGAFGTQLYLATSPDLDGGGVLIDSQPVPDGLAPAASAALTFSGSFNRPAMGKYYLVLQADPTDPDGGAPLGAVDEIDEGNNLRALTVYMGTDLTGTISAPAAGDVGAQVPVQVSIINQGVDAAPGPFDYQVFISADETFDTSDVQVASGTVQPSDLPLNSSLQVTIPQNVPATDFYWFLAIDPTSAPAPQGAITEADETNNIARTTGQTHARVPDLLLTSIQALDVASPHAPVTRAFFGKQILLRVTVQNQGEAAATDFDIGLFLSGGLGGPVITTHDPLLDDPHFATLPSGATLTYDDVVTVPVTDPNGAAWTAGNYYFGAIADSLSLIGESNEGNNINKVGPLFARGPGPDFVPVELDVATQAAVGEVLPVFRVIRNSGNKSNAGANDPACPYRYYLSANATITTEDIPLQILVNGSPTAEGTVKLDIGADSRATELVQIPAGVAPGRYHLGVLVDPDQGIDDIDYSNNALSPVGTIDVAPGALAITTTALPEGVVGAGYAVQLLASGGATYSWSLAPGSTLPEGLSLSSDGLLSGTPGAPGSTPLVVQASANGATVSAGLVLTVRPVAGPLQVITSNLPSAIAGQTYSGQIVAVGGVGPYTFSRVGGALPTGLNLASTGVVSGVPSAGNTAPATFAVLVTDTTGATASAQVVLRVTSPRSLRITTGVLPPGTVSQTYPPAGTDNTILAVNGTTPYRFEVTAGALPPGLSLSAEPDRVQLTGKPAEAGLFPFTVTVTDASGQVDARDYAITVIPNGLSLEQVALPPVKPGEDYDADLSAAAVRATWSVYSGSLPPGITLDATGHLGGTCDPDATPGNYAFIAHAVDRNGRIGVIPEAIAVVPADKRPIPEASGCSSSSGGAVLLALLPVFGLLLRRRRNAALLAMLAASAPALAHAGYTATSSSATYQAFPVTPGQTLTSGRNTAASLNLPFTFRFFGQAYGSISVGTNGYIAFGSDASAPPSFSGGAPILAVWGDGLEVTTSNSGSVSYVINGVSPNRELVIQWANAANAADEGEFGFGFDTLFNFQAHLHENGQIDFTYGSATSQQPGSSATAALVGLSDGANNTVAGLACSASFGSCGFSQWPANTKVVFVPGTDLAVPSLTSAGVAFQNSTTNLIATATNAGGQPVADTSVQLVLSSDGMLGNADDQVVATVPNISLNAGQSVPLTIPFDVGQLQAGSYFFFATIDPANTVAEDDETNNTFGPVRLDVVAPAPDLAMGVVTASTHAAAVGDSFGLSFTVRNASTVASSPTPYAVYLSGNEVISSADLQVGSGTVAPLDGGDSAPVSAQVTLPSTVAAGRYYLGVVVNPTLSVAETNALNDAAYDPVQLAVHTDTLAVVPATGSSLPATSVGAVYQYALSASGGDGQYTFSSSSVPPGLTLDASGLLHGRPSASSAQPYAFEVAVADGSGHTASATLNLQVADGSLALTVLTHDLVSGEYGLPYLQSLSAVGGVPPYVWALGSVGKLPGGVSLGPDGVLEGIPRESGAFSFSVTVTDAAPTPHTANATLQVSVSAASLVPRIGSPQLPDAMVDSPYQVVLTVSGGFPPYYWQFPYCPDPSTCKPVTRFPAVPTDGPPQAIGMPAGLYFSCDASGNALLTSTPPNVPPDQGGSPCYNPGIPADAPNVPKEAGIYAIPAVITDSANQTVKVVYTVRIGVGQDIAITTTQLPDALTGREYKVALQADSPKSKGAIHWSLACSERGADGQPQDPCPESLPPGLSLSEDGVISGTPTDGSGKTYAFLVRAADDENRVDVRAEAITSHEPESKPKSSGCGSAPGELTLALLVPFFALGLRRRHQAR